MAETFKDKLKRWTELATAAKAFVLALVALVAALAALGTGVAYLNKIMAQITMNKEQTKASAVILAGDVDKLNKAAQQNHDDLVALNEYILSLGESRIDQALAPASASAAVRPPPPIWPRLPQDAGVAPPATATPSVVASAPPVPTGGRDGDGIPEVNKKRRPPQPGPRPEPIDPTKATDVFKP